MSRLTEIDNRLRELGTDFTNLMGMVRDCISEQENILLEKDNQIKELNARLDERRLLTELKVINELRTVAIDKSVRVVKCYRCKEEKPAATPNGKYCTDCLRLIRRSIADNMMAKKNMKLAVVNE